MVLSISLILLHFAFSIVKYSVSLIDSAQCASFVLNQTFLCYSCFNCGQASCADKFTNVCAVVLGVKMRGKS